ncbi:50S ribosomal protein L25/general stress protein Ctc [Microbacterium sediminis]|uniref:Large ribosomal subunit protein bL25 n=1 Tax=Microbacterium sediminis TaxID=904291 RepID=A0A1B9NJ53_9MICO|nr:50S ribosomal protein L25/general stress protein Ctc [Microbacterium sediminis]OCG76600.1 50S ribosomal protein L25/general stress protein Ctc [Microbacterium sediminis]QBR73795.1 50S ribosomal protein L25/general stress protein Ctc [Microbacterium sediminis]
MSENFTLNADVRTEFGKGFARRLRAAGKIPAVIYGHGGEPVHVALPGHETALIVRHANALIELSIEGKQELVLVKDVQKDPVRQVIEHIDLIVVKQGEKITVDVPIVVTGESFPGTIHTLETTSLSVEVEATHIPEHFEVSVEGLEDGAHITAGDVTLPQGASLVTDAETLVVAISTPRGEVEAEGEESADETAAAESAE